MDPFLGEIRAFSFGRIPKGWAACAGQMMSISQNQALFALLGTYYGGDGATNFALPDLRGRAPVGFGQVTGGVTLPLGTMQGNETVALTEAQIPAHIHSVLGTTAAATTNVPTGSALAQATDPEYAPLSSASMNAAAVGTGGGSGAGHENMQPSLPISWCIATSGIFPSRN